MSSGIGGNWFNTIVSLAGVAAAAFTGGASLVATQALTQVATQAFSQAATQVLGQVAGNIVSNAFSQLVQEGFKELEGWGSQVVSDAANGMLHALNNQGTNGAYTGDVDRAQNQLVDAFAQNIQQNQDAALSIAQMGQQQDKDGGATNAKGKGSWLWALAKVMGEKIDESADKMIDMANKVNADGKNASASTNFQVASQEFGLIMNSITTAIKSIGEGLQTAARKQ